MKYLKVFTNFADDIEELSDAECGRLFRAMMQYASSKAVPEFKGNERFFWKTVKRNIDTAIDAYERKVKSIGNARDSKQDEINMKSDSNHDENKESLDRNHDEINMKSTQDNDNDNDKDNDNDNDKDNGNGKGKEKVKEKVKVKASTSPCSPPPGETAAAAAIDPDVKEVARAWDRASGVTVSTREQEMLLDLLDAHGKERMLRAIDECVRAKAVNLRYLEAVLEGRGKRTSDVDEQQAKALHDAAVKRMEAIANADQGI